MATFGSFFIEKLSLFQVKNAEANANAIIKLSSRGEAEAASGAWREATWRPTTVIARSEATKQSLKPKEIATPFGLAMTR
jgi:hypothetical protein